MVLLSWVVCLVILFKYANSEEEHWFSDEFIEFVNSQNTTWKAGRNFPKGTKMEEIRIRLGWIRNENPIPMPVKQHDASIIASLPDYFDPRTKWPKCKTLNDIRDQGACGNDWAISATAAMTDRVCIYSKRAKKFYFSAQDLTSCSEDTVGCWGGYHEYAWKFWKQHGIVSGGPYNSKQGCRPYEIEPCEHHVHNGTRKPCGERHLTPLCLDSCTMPKIHYKKDKHFGHDIYTVEKNEEHIKAELFTHGPVQACFMVYSDFPAYKSGVYEHLSGDLEGVLCVKLLGWGVLNGVKYWLAANSWNTDWGDQGYFKIKRGVNMCRIETYVAAGLPEKKYEEDSK